MFHQNLIKGAKVTKNVEYLIPDKTLLYGILTELKRLDVWGITLKLINLFYFMFEIVDSFNQAIQITEMDIGFLKISCIKSR